MIKAVIYDLDDLMVNSVELHFRAFDEALKEYNHSLDEVPISTQSRFVGVRIIDISKELIDFFDLDTTLEEFYKKRTDIFLSLVKDVQAMPGLLESLKLFKSSGLKLAIASSGTMNYIDIIVDKFKIRSYFDVIVSGDDVSKGKPDPETYIVAANRLQLKPTECVVLEDATNGINAAKAAGCKCIAVINVYTPEQNLSGADRTVKSLNEITMDMIRSLV